jgi:hypothetical protein
LEFLECIIYTGKLELTEEKKENFKTKNNQIKFIKMSEVDALV